jgi:DNA-binding MltR family transcriptional regulator
MSKKIVPDVRKLSEESTHLYEVLNNESDLACVLIATSYLDYALASLLKRYFIESTLVDKLLEPPRGSVSSFASRCDLTYCLGLISKSFYQNLEIVGRIRNSFAHSYLSLSLGDTEIAKLVDSLIPATVHQTITIVGSEAKHEGPAPMPLPGSTRDRFNVIIVLMVNSLLLTGLAMKHREKKTGGWQ